MELKDCETKICSKCKIEKPLTDFHKQKDGPQGRRSHCKTCCANYNNSHNHGMSVEEREQFLRERDYRCEVCGISRETASEVFKRDLHIDHCHIDGENKGLLCLMCNGAAGRLKDSPELAKRLYEYLERTRKEV
jgi:hypothetical protein